MTRTCTRPPRGFCAGPGPGGPSLDDDSDCGVVVSAPACAAIYALLGALLSRRPMAIQDRPRRRRDREAATLRRVLLEGLHMSAPVRYGMIVLDAAPIIVRLRGADHLPRKPSSMHSCTTSSAGWSMATPRAGGRCIRRMGRSTRSRAQGPGRHQPAPINWSPPACTERDARFLGG